MHAAGVSPQMGSARKIMEINALGTVHITEAFHGIAAEGLALVHVASIAGHMMPRFLAPKRTYALASTDVDRFAHGAQLLHEPPAESFVLVG